MCSFVLSHLAFSLGMVPSTSIHGVAHGSAPSFSWLSSVPLQTCTAGPLPSRPSAHAQVAGRPRALAAVNDAAVNVGRRDLSTQFCFSLEKY